MITGLLVGVLLVSILLVGATTYIVINGELTDLGSVMWVLGLAGTIISISTLVGRAIG